MKNGLSLDADIIELKSSYILVVEDDVGLNRLINKTLERSGYKTKKVYDGKSVLECEDLNSYNLILLDYILPDMTGKDVIEDLKKKDCNIPFVIMTGYGDELLAVEMMKLGACDYIVKEEKFLDILPQRIDCVIKKFETEKKLEVAEESLKKQEIKLQSIFQAAPTMIGFTANNLIIELNKQIEGMLGFSKKELIGKNMEVLFSSKNEFKRFEEEMLKQIKESEMATIEVKWKRKDTKIIDALINVKPFESLDFSAGFTFTALDITNKNRAEKDLKETTQLLRTVLDSIPDIIWVQDKDHNIIQYNQSSISFLNKTKDRVKGKKCYEFIGRTSPCEICATTEVYKTKKPAQVERYIDNIGIWLDCRSYPILDENGNILKVVEHLRDITQKKESEKKLIENKQRFALALDGEKAGLWDWNIQTGNSVYDKSWASILGYKLDDITLDIDSWRALVHPDDLKGVLNLIDDHFNKKTDYYSAEFRMKTSSGKWKWVHSRGKVVEWNKNKPVRMIGTQVDITERKKYEEELIRTKEYLQNIINSASEIVISFDKENRITMWNKTAENLTGYKQNRLIGRNISKIPIIENYKNITESIEFLNKKQTREIKDIVFNTKDGIKKIIKPSYSIIKDEKGEPYGFLLVGKDITYELERHGRLLKGNCYLIDDPDENIVLTLFSNLTKIGYNGLYITRSNPNFIKSKTSGLDIEIAILNQSPIKGYKTVTNLEELIKIIKDFGIKNKETVILLDRIDYLITMNTFEDFIKTLYQISGIIVENNSILILYTVPTLLNKHQKAILKGETKDLPNQNIENIQIEDELFEMLKYIHEQNQKNTLVSFTNIGKRFLIVRATTAKKLNILLKQNLINIKKHGRSKTIYVSEKGKALLNRRKTL